MKHNIILFSLFLFCSISLHAAVVSGTCGDNLTWTLNTRDSTLTISGSGAMTYSSGVPWYEYKSYVAHVSLLDGVTSIGDGAFMYCPSLTSVTIPNSVTSIGDQAFGYCWGLTSVTIPNSVISIGNYAFNYCVSLTSVTIGNSVTSIGSAAFWECSGLTSITIPNSVISIGSSAFCNCSSLTDVTIPNSVTSIGNYAFRDCSGLTSVTIPNSVTSIGDQAFRNCYGLTSVTIGNSVTSIGEWAFLNCSRLTSVTLGNSVASIGRQAFESCPVSTLTVLAAIPPTGGAGCGINAASCNLYVRSSSLETYQNTIWWEDFASINAVATISYAVIFRDMDGTNLSVQYVDEGESAVTPADPTREGYTFIGWNKDFSNVTEDLIVTAQYEIHRFEVKFQDWDGSVLKTDSVDWNTAAVTPADPTREGYTFVGWDKDFSHITSDITITAQYEVNYYPVTFLDYDGTLLSEQSVAYNQAATAPELPAREGYRFIGWSTDITHIVSRTFAIALYEHSGSGDILLVGDVNHDGVINVMDATEIINIYLNNR